MEQQFGRGTGNGEQQPPPTSPRGRSPPAPTSVSWVPDDASDTCMLCDRRFGTLWRRRHHCRVYVYVPTMLPSTEIGEM